MSAASSRRGAAALVAALALLTAACKGDAHPHAFTTTTRATTTTSSTSTTAVPPTTAAPIAIAVGTKLVTTSTGVVSPVVRVNADGTVTIKTPCENEATVRGATAIGPVDILIDPGHGGNELGAVGSNGLAEKTVNLAVAKDTIAALTAAGYHPLLTRTADYRVTLVERANIAHAANPKVLVSEHHNGGSDGPSDKPGTEVYYQHPSADSKRLAGLIYEEVFAALSKYPGVAWQANTDAGAKPRLNTSGGDYYGMLRNPAPVVSVIAEMLFLSNPPEAALVARPDVQQAEGDAVARGIIRYLTTSDPGSGFVTPVVRTTPAGPGGGLAGCVDPPLQ